jgi:hypothetical protein
MLDGDWSSDVCSSDLALPDVISVQDLHSLHGTADGVSLLASQFTVLARILATVVFPVPLGPEKRMAWARRPEVMALARVVVTWACPTTSSKVWGLYFLARTR